MFGGKFSPPQKRSLDKTLLLRHFRDRIFKLFGIQVRMQIRSYSESHLYAHVLLAARTCLACVCVTARLGALA